MFQHVLNQVQTMSLFRETFINFQYQLICQMEQFFAIDVSMKCVLERYRVPKETWNLFTINNYKINTHLELLQGHEISYSDNRKNRVE